MSRLILCLGDQLSDTLSALAVADKARGTVVMAEVADEAGYVPNHPKKIAFLFAAMREFATHHAEEGWTVAYTRLDDPATSGSIPGELFRRAEVTGSTTVLATEPGEWRLIGALRDRLKSYLMTDSSPATAISRLGPRAGNSSSWSTSIATCAAKPDC